VRTIAGALLLVFIAWAQVSPAATQPKAATPMPCMCAVTVPPALPDIRGTEQNPLSVKVVQQPPPPAAEKDWSGRVIAAATLVLAGVTAALAIFTWRLWRSTGALVSGADATARRQLRAYVSVKESRIDRLGPEEYPEAQIQIRNFGQTPAYKFAVSAQIAIGETLEHPPKEPDKVLGHLAPGAEYIVTVSAPFLLAKPLHYQLHQGAKTVFVHGIINYVDAFGMPHFTHFRTLTGGTVGVRGNGLVSAGEGNNTDDDF
jgi:hypothetical protein